jgi:hypothetical protein
VTRVEIDAVATNAEVGALVARTAEMFLKPVADVLTTTATQIAASHFRRVGPGVASIHNEYFPQTVEYRVSYDGDKHSYMGLWEIGTREFAPRPYLRPAVTAVQHS